MMSALLAAVILAAPAAAARTLLEGTTASANTVFVDTKTVRVHIATAGYGGGVPNVALFSSSNAAWGTSINPGVVIYATGSVVAGDIRSTTYTFTSGAVFGSVFQSSCTSLTLATGITSTAFEVCQSTVSLTLTRATQLRARFTGTCVEAASGHTCGWGLLVNGSHPSPLSRLRGVALATTFSALSPPLNISGEFLIPSQNAGTVNVCIPFASSNAVSTICPTGAGSLDAACQFCIEEAF